MVSIVSNVKIILKVIHCTEFLVLLVFYNRSFSYLLDEKRKNYDKIESHSSGPQIYAQSRPIHFSVD